MRICFRCLTERIDEGTLDIDVGDYLVIVDNNCCECDRCTRVHQED